MRRRNLLSALALAHGLCAGAVAHARQPEPRPGDINGDVIADLSRRPLDALEAEQRMTRAEIQDLERRIRILSGAQESRKTYLRQRLRVLYKLSQGGFGRLLLQAESPPEVYHRRDAARRILNRDLEELRGLRDELKEVATEQAELSGRVARLSQLDKAIAHARGELQAGGRRDLFGLAQKRGLLRRPVLPGTLVGPFGRDPTDHRLELFRHGAELAAEPGEPVRAVAAGQVRYIGEMADLGRGVIVEHEGGYLTLYARVDQLTVVVGDTISAGAPLGKAPYSKIYFQLALGDLPLDPEPWFQSSARVRGEPLKRKREP